MRITSLVVTSVLLVACSSSPSGARPTSTPTPPSGTLSASSASPFPSPSPASTPSPLTGTPAPAALTCTSTPAAGERLVLVTLQGVPGVVVRDLTDISHPITRCTFSGGYFFRFVSAMRVSYDIFAPTADHSGPQTGWQGAPGAMYVSDLKTGATSLVRVWPYTYHLLWLYAWSPDGLTLAYVNLSANGDNLELHLLSAVEDRTVAAMPSTTFGYASCWSGFQSDAGTVGFSADGKYVAFVSTSIWVARVADGHRMSVAGDVISEPYWSVWSGSGARFLVQAAHLSTTT
jgi:hypothetical protein